MLGVNPLDTLNNNVQQFNRNLTNLNLEDMMHIDHSGRALYSSDNTEWGVVQITLPEFGEDGYMSYRIFFTYLLSPVDTPECYVDLGLFANVSDSDVGILVQSSEGYMENTTITANTASHVKIKVKAIESGMPHKKYVKFILKKTS